MNPAAILTIITAAMQLAPLATETVIGIKHLLARDPSVPEQLQQILLETEQGYDATLNAIAEWMKANPGV